MNGQVLKPYTVFMRRRRGSTSGRIVVQATCPSHAERVAVRQNIEVSHPDTKPADWIVTSVEPGTLHQMADIDQRARQLVKDAAAAGFVITIEQVPLRPLAMGHYTTTVAVRAARELAA